MEMETHTHNNLDSDSNVDVDLNDLGASAAAVSVLADIPEDDAVAAAIEECRGDEAEMMRPSIPLPPLPKMQSHIVVYGGQASSSMHSMEAWAEKYDYYITCMVGSLRRRMSPQAAAHLDWVKVRRSLIKYAYWTSATRYRSYVMLK